jgi:hypothetical protein
MNIDKCVDWFIYQYRVTKDELHPILWDAERLHAIEIVDLFRCCVILSGDGHGIDLLKNHVAIVCKMADCGYTGAIAGEKLRDYFLVDKILNQNF